MATGTRTRSRPRINVPGGLAGFLWLLIVLLPVYYVVLTSLRDQQGFYESNPLVPPAEPTVDAYQLVLESDFPRYLANSVIVTLGTVASTVTVSLMAAYFVVRSRAWLSGLTYKAFLLVLAIPLTVIILANFLRDVPNELFESMRLDGAGHWRMLVRLVVPLVRPAVVTVAVYDGLQVWNGFLYPLILTQSPGQRVLPKPAVRPLTSCRLPRM